MVGANMNKNFFIALIAAALQGCAGLTQFPEDLPSPVIAEDENNSKSVLKAADPQFLITLEKIEATIKPHEKRAFRNSFIEQRIRIIDIRFKEFAKALVKDDVQFNFGANLLEIAVGATGAFVPETASQVLSGASAALAGGIEAYNKVAFFDQAMPAMFAQMVANRKSIQVRILEGMNNGIGEYPLIAAMQDLEDYYIAGSIPGAIISTAEDAQKKKDEAEVKLDELRVSAFSEDESSKVVAAFIWPGGDRSQEINSQNVEQLRTWIERSPLSGIPIQRFLDSKDLQSFRLQAIEEIPITPSQ